MTYFAQPIVEEKERKLKYMMNIMGLKTLPYWIGNFLVDYFIMLLYVIVFVICGSAIENVDLLKEGMGNWVICVLIPGFAVCLLQSYMISFFYQKVS